MITAHALAKLLLAGPDIPVAHDTEFGNELLEGNLHVDPEAHYHFPEDWEFDPEGAEQLYLQRLKFYKPEVARMYCDGVKRLKFNAPQREVLVIE